MADHLGTPLLQTDSSANVYWRAEYEPYGKVWALRASDVHQPLRLPGQVAEQFDTGANGATERTYNVFRWYRSGWGKYSQGDPLGIAGGVNPYEYASGNPITTIDPLGLKGGVCRDPVTGRLTFCQVPDAPRCAPSDQACVQATMEALGFIPAFGAALAALDVWDASRKRDTLGAAVGLACAIPVARPLKHVLPWARRISRHHIFPQQFRAEFKAIFGEDIIDRFTIPMTNAEHYALHPQWNREWRALLQKARLTTTDLWDQARKMMHEHGICECNLRPFR